MGNCFGWSVFCCLIFLIEIFLKSSNLKYWDYFYTYSCFVYHQQSRPRVQGQTSISGVIKQRERERESIKTKKATGNQSQAIWQTTHSVFRISSQSGEARGAKWFTIWATITAQTVGQCGTYSTPLAPLMSVAPWSRGPLSAAAFSIRLWQGEHFWHQRWSIFCLQTTAHMSLVWLCDLTGWFSYSLISAESHCFRLWIITRGGGCR